MEDLTSKTEKLNLDEKLKLKDEFENIIKNHSEDKYFKELLPLWKETWNYLAKDESKDIRPLYDSPVVDQFLKHFVIIVCKLYAYKKYGRFVYDVLEGRKSICLYGARGVGKTTLMKGCKAVGEYLCGKSLFFIIS